MHDVAEPSKTQVNKAGKVLRRFKRGDAVDAHDYRHARAVLGQHRSAHATALAAVLTDLRSVVAELGIDAEVSSRLKRTPTIIDKLARRPTMRLAAMQDIAGCRAVVTSIDEIRRTQAELGHVRPGLRTVDYITDPRPSGYRGVHVIVADGDRPVEVQLRTRVMHRWAMTVERLSIRTGYDLTSSEGPSELLERLHAAALAAAAEESMENNTPALQILDNLRVEFESRFGEEPR